MSQTVETVESEGCSQDKFPSIFHNLGDTADDFYNVDAVEDTRGNEICNGETIQDYLVDR